MPRLPRWLLTVVLVAVTAVVGLYLYPSESTRLKRQLDDLASACSFESGPPKATELASMKDALTTQLSSPVVLDVAELGESSRTHEEVIQAAALYTQSFQALRLRLENVQVELDASGTHAVAKGALFVEQVDPSGSRRTEPRRFSTTFAKRDGKWLIIHAKVSESRIDQPEARP